VRALAIDGVLDPRLWSRGWQIASDRVATQLEVDGFLAQCDLAAAQCPFWAPGGAARRWEQLARALRAAPTVLPGGDPYPYDQLVSDGLIAMYLPELWPAFASLFDRIGDAVAGDRAAAAGITTARRALLAQLAPGAVEADYENGLDAQYGNVCADAQFPSSFGEFRLVDLYAQAGSRFGPLWWWSNAGCANWPVNPTGTRGRGGRGRPRRCWWSATTSTASPRTPARKRRPGCCPTAAC
jgi:hypothetical protein